MGQILFSDVLIVSGGKTVPAVNLGSATSVPEFWLREIRVKSQIIRENLFRKSQM